MKRTFQKKLESLSLVHQFIGHFGARHKLDDKVLFQVNLAVEELFVNMIRYPSAPREGGISIGLAREADRIVVTLLGYNTDSFDITTFKPYDTEKPLEERKVGGIGIYLVGKTMDEVSYHHDPRKRISQIVLTKYLRT